MKQSFNVLLLSYKTIYRFEYTICVRIQYKFPGIYIFILGLCAHWWKSQWFNTKDQYGLYHSANCRLFQTVNTPFKHSHVNRQLGRGHTYTWPLITVTFTRKVHSNVLPVTTLEEKQTNQWLQHTHKHSIHQKGNKCIGANTHTHRHTHTGTQPRTHTHTHTGTLAHRLLTQVL